MSVTGITIDEFRDATVRASVSPKREEIGKVIGLENGYTWDQWIAEIEFNEHSQDPVEFAQLLVGIRGSKSILEVGSRFGGTLRRMAEVLAPQSTVVCIDLPMEDGMTLDPAPSLRANCKRIQEMGHHVELFLANSRDPVVIEKVRGYGPYDFCFIDGDHSYDGVKADWENYGPMAKIVGFHDIINPPSEVDKLWAEIKPHYKHVEFINYDGGRQLGIGVLFK